MVGWIVRSDNSSCYLIRLQLSLEFGMFQEEKTFNFRFTLEATFPENYEGPEDEYAWLRDWEARVKPELLKTIFESLRRYPSWSIHVRNRGRSPLDEIEVAMIKDFSGERPG